MKNTFGKNSIELKNQSLQFCTGSFFTASTASQDSAKGPKSIVQATLTTSMALKVIEAKVYPREPLMILYVY